MRRRNASLLLAVGVMLASATGLWAADEKTVAAPAAPKKAEKPAPAATAQLATEGQYSVWLVQVLGLSRFVSTTPTAQECFALLLQNRISPKNGWNATNVVTKATLARTVVQAMGNQSNIKDPNNDAEWIEYLKSTGVQIPTLGEALNNLDPLDAPLGNQAVVVTTDPLGKLHRIRPVDEQQMGADLSVVRQLLRVVEETPPPAPTPTPRPRPEEGPDDDGPDLTPA